MKKKQIMTTNANGVTVKVCCASCEFKTWKADCMRWCTKRKAEVAAGNYCNRWRMSEQMKRAGKRGDGRVKRKEYLRFLLEVREAEWRAEEQGQAVPEKSIEEIRALFEQKHGSIYFNI